MIKSVAFAPRRLQRALGIALSATVFVVLGALAEAPASPKEAARFMGVDEIRPGMKGVGYSVFSREGRVSFDAEIIDVLHQSGPKRDLILAELRGAVVDEAGIIAGMSGSPVYIDGRLIGAVAYGWAFSKRPIAGITPIGEMLDVMNMPEPAEDRAAGMPLDRPMPALPPALEARGESARDEPGDGLVPLRVPVMVSGLSDEGADALRRALAPLRMEVVEGASGETTPPERSATSFEPGDPISIPLARGDASIAVFGTVTYADGKRLVAFGHPVFHTGGQKLPMAGGQVVGVMASAYQSFKFSTAADPVGCFFSDQTPGVAGRLGNPPKMLPVSLTLDGPTGRQEFNFEVVRDYFLTAPVIQSLTSGTIGSRIYRAGLGTITTDVRVVFQDGSDLTYRNVVATLAPSEQAAAETAGPLGTLFGNPYAEPSVARIELRARVETNVRFAAIDLVEILDRHVRPGDTIRLRVVLRPYRGDLQEQIIPFEVPASMPVGSAVLKVCDRTSLEDWDRERAPDKYRPRDLGDFMQQLRSMPAHNQIEIRLFVPGSSLVVDGEEMPRLPPSMREALGNVHISGGRAAADGVEIKSLVVEMDQHVQGCHTLSLEVENR